jgi:hypothetical protein
MALDAQKFFYFSYTGILPILQYLLVFLVCDKGYLVLARYWEFKG